jgi:hypothetical protein
VSATDWLLVLSEGSAQTGAHRRCLPAPNFRSGGFLSSSAFSEADKSWTGLVRRTDVSWLPLGDRLALLPDVLVSEIKGRTGEEEVVEIIQTLEPGQNVQITRGPFQGLEALVTRVTSSKERVEILIECMGRTLQAEASFGDLLPLIEYSAPSRES